MGTVTRRSILIIIAMALLSLCQLYLLSTIRYKSAPNQTSHSNRKHLAVGESAHTERAVLGPHREIIRNANEENQNDDEENLTDDTRRICATWIPNEERKVLFVRLKTWKEYYSPNSSKTGEYYMSASLDYALRHHGFRVTVVSVKEFESMNVTMRKSFYRIFYRMPPMRWHSFFNDHDLICKVRPLYYFGDWYPGKTIGTFNDVFFDPRQMISASSEHWNTFIGYFPHNILRREEADFPSPKRGRTGLLLGKEPEYFEPYRDVIEALIARNFTLYTTCEKCPFPKSVKSQSKLGPKEYANLMSSYAFMIGFGKPFDSPSPLVGLSHGVAFINPLRTQSNSKKWVQHKPLSRLGMPYVYNVDLSSLSEVIQAAEWSVKYRFSSYVPPEYRVGAMLDRVCSILEDDSLCMCPNPIFSNITIDFHNNMQNKFGSDVNSMDCRASSYVKKQKRFPPVGRASSAFKLHYFE